MIEKTMQIDRMENVISVFGSFDQNLHIIETELGVIVSNRDDHIRIAGEAENVMHAERAIEGLLSLAARGEAIDAQNVRYIIKLVQAGQEGRIEDLARGVVCVTAKGKPIKPKTIGQTGYVEAIKKNTVTLGVGPAGTGKTYLAVACAVQAFREKQVNRIVLTRPAVEAGERLGFLPGDLKDKLDPYLQPLYDALEDMIPSRKLNEFMADGTIQIAPLAYMRGRTLDRACVILDEAQNTNLGQLKMFLTRMGTSAKFIVTGDATQIDLPRKSDSGLLTGIQLLKGLKGVAAITFRNEDIVRHPLVTKIVRAFDEEENRARNFEDA